LKSYCNVFCSLSGFGLFFQIGVYLFSKTMTGSRRQILRRNKAECTFPLVSRPLLPDTAQFFSVGNLLVLSHCECNIPLGSHFKIFYFAALFHRARRCIFEAAAVQPPAIIFLKLWDSNMLEIFCFLPSILPSLNHSHLTLAHSLTTTAGYVIARYVKKNYNNWKIATN